LYKPKIARHVRLAAGAFLLFFLTVIVLAQPAAARLDELLVSPSSAAGTRAVPALGTALRQDFYEVKPGDTLFSIAAKNGVSAELLALVNGIENRDYLPAGQLLRLPQGMAVHLVKPGEMLLEIAGLYGVDVPAIAARNHLTDPDRILAGQKLLIPLDAGREKVAGQWSLSWPLVGAITSRFGLRDGRPHEGIDIAADEGTPIRAAARGRVVYAGPRGTYGLAVIVDHGGGFTTLYAHCSKILVPVGSTVGPDTVIALAGNTGRSSGPHLHFEVRKDGVPRDPLLWLAGGPYYG